MARKKESEQPTLTEQLRRFIHETGKTTYRLWKDTGTMSWLELQLPSVEEGVVTPFGVADQLLRQSGELVRGEEDK